MLRKYADHVEFLAPDTAFLEASERLPDILEGRGLPVLPAMQALNLIARIVQTIDTETYSKCQTIAHERIDRRDEGDWPVLASALALDCPIWTEDTDFFGCGVATRTTDRVELYLAEASSAR